MKLIEMLPSFYHDSNFVKAYISSHDVEHELIEESIKDLVDNLYVDSATWGLDLFEEKLGIKTNKNKDYQERREYIKAKKRGSGTTTVAVVKNIAEAFSGSEVEVIEDYSNYLFKIRFVGEKGVPKNINDFKKIIEEIKPAHLAYELEFTYNTHRDLFGRTHGELAKYTHRELREVLK